MLQSAQSHSVTTFPDNYSTDRVCQRCHQAFEPGRKLKATTRYCYACALQLRRARVAAWKQRKLSEIGKQQFLYDYAQCCEKRNAYMSRYMHDRRQRAREQAAQAA